MTGIMLLTHGMLGESLIQTAMHVLNQCPERTRRMGIAARDEPLHMLAQARRVLKAMAGVNVPMLIRAPTYREQPLDTMIVKAVSGGCEGVLRVPSSTLHYGATGT